MTCLQAVNRGNASVSGSGREAWVGGLSGHLCAWMAGWGEKAENGAHHSVPAVATAVAMAAWTFTMYVLQSHQQRRQLGNNTELKELTRIEHLLRIRHHTVHAASTWM